MIQLYTPKNENYEYNGDYILDPLLCEFDCELNGVWQLTIRGLRDKNAEYIVENAVISVDLPFAKKQLFRIISLDKTDYDVQAIAVPIFLTNDHYFFDTRIVQKNGQQALDIMLQGTKYKGHSDIIDLSNIYLVNRSLNEAIHGDNNSFLSRYGGEVFYNNFEVYVNKQIGIDNHMRAEFGFNLTGIKESIDMSSVITRIIPKAYNGHMLPNNETVDSSNISNYLPRKFPPTVFEYSDIKLKEDASEEDIANGVIVCDSLDQLHIELRKRAKKEFEINHVDIPKVTYEVNVADISKTELYKGYENLTKVSLGDIVYVKHRRLGIETQSRVISLKYDCITKSIIELTLGDYKTNYFDELSNVQDKVDNVIDNTTGTILGDKISGIINLLNTSLRAQKDIAQRQDVRALLFEDLDTSSPTFGALCIGTQGIEISKKRNPENTDWVWGTAINFESVIADYIITGILSDKQSKFILNLDTGELKMKDGKFSGTVEGGVIKGSDISGGTITGTTIKTDKDLYVGNNIYIGDQKSAIYKKINLTENVHIGLSDDGPRRGFVLRSYNDRITFGGGFFNIYIEDKPFLQCVRDFLFISLEDETIMSMSKSHIDIKKDLWAKECMFYSVFVNGDLLVKGDLSVMGSKHRVVNTSKGCVAMNAIESADAVFEDFGTSITDDYGFSTVVLDELFLETVSTDYDYHVFLTPYADVENASVFIYSKNIDSFTIKGTPNTRFDWRITAKQKNYEKERMKVMRFDSFEKKRPNFNIK